MANKKSKPLTAGVLRLKPKSKKKISKRGSSKIKAIAALAGGAYGYNETPSITGTMFGKENENILADIGLEMGAVKGAEKIAQTKLLKKILKGIGKKATSRLALGAVPGVGTAAAIGLGVGDLISVGKDLYGMTPKERGNIWNAFKSLPSAGKNLSKKNRAKTQTRFKEQIDRSKAPAFRSTKKKGGRVGRPKGVGCATRGYGKAMKRGK